MNKSEPFTAEEGVVPLGDAARQAVDSLRGYAYQVTAAALAWLDLPDKGQLFLEVAEDYAVVVRQAIEAVQVKDTEASGTVTLNTESVRDAVSDFVTLTARNPNADVHLRYFTTSEIGTERAVEDRPGGMAGLTYWRNAASGADVGPLRSILESDKFKADVHGFVKARTDEALRSDLLRKIHWDCGKPDLASLRKEFESRLIVVGRDTFNLAAPEAARTADVLIYKVLQRSIASDPAERVLTRAELYSAVDEATRISVPRAAADSMLALISSGLASSVFAGLGTGLPVTVSEPGWIVPSSALPVASGMVNRQDIESEVAASLRRFGTSIVTGASGLGKSSVAHSVARRLATEFVVVDFRDCDVEETRSQLDTMVSRIGGLSSSIFILEDLNHLSDSRIATSLGRVFEALRRRDRLAIITCYLPPTARALSTTGLDAGCKVECRYFTEEEAASLVALHGGDPKQWGRLSYVTGAFGHPQLVHAFIVGMAARGWPSSEVVEILGGALSSGDIEAERESARRTLVSALPDNSRSLLYRLSLTIGRFDRAMALAVADAPPSIPRAGECLDALIGPWLETMGYNSYRVSPLAAKSGHGMIPAAERTGIHSAIATQLTAGGTINGSDVDEVLLQAVLGKNEQVLSKLALSISSASDRVVELLADNTTAFKLLRTDVPVYPENVRVSAMLRLAQFKLLAATEDAEKITQCANALLRETEDQPDEGLRSTFRAVGLGVVLGTMGIANYLDNWLELIHEFGSITRADTFLSGLRDNFEAGASGPRDMLGALFAIGSSNLSSVERLESLINRMDRLPPDDRSLYLHAVSSVAPDYSVFINRAWTVESQQETLDGRDAAERYRRMAITTASWPERALTVQCWVAQSVMLDEYCNDSDGALKVLDEAAEVTGEEVALSRARAKVYWRGQDHERALAILRGIADEVGRDNHVERAFALREAAISAAKCGEWEQAEEWFVEGGEAACQVQLPDMAAMAIGLGADAAVAALHAGQTARALVGLRDALRALKGIDPTSSVRAAYCHHVVRHTVLWTQSQIDNSRLEIDGAPIEMAPGCCSNPEPAKGIVDRPLGSLDVAWYLLAGTEVTSGESVGIAENLQAELAGGPIAMCEVDLRNRAVVRAIADLNGVGFARALWGFVEAMVYLSRQGRIERESFDVRQPPRGTIPAVARAEASSPMASGLVRDAVLAYVIVATCKGSFAAVTVLMEAMTAEFGQDGARAILVRATTMLDLPAAASFDEALIDCIRPFRGEPRPTPNVYAVAAIRFTQYVAQSNFKRSLIPIFAQWQRDAWERIVSTQTFALSRPLKTVPAIENALSIADNNERFLGTLCLSIAEAVGITLPEETRASLAMMAARS